MKNITGLALALWLSMVGVHAADSLYDVPLKDIDGKDTSLAQYKGQVILIVNVASKCGNTPQYAALEAAYTNYQAKGFVICGFPCNQFQAAGAGHGRRTSRCSAPPKYDRDVSDVRQAGRKRRQPGIRSMCYAGGTDLAVSR